MADMETIAASLNSLLVTYGVTRDQMADLLGGSADGGPAGDGNYPVTTAAGVTIMVPSPRRLAALSGDLESATAVIQPMIDSARAARDQAIGSRDEAREAATRSETAGARTTFAVRSPFQPAATFAGAIGRQPFRDFLLGVDLSGLPGYDPTRFYSFAEMLKSASAVVLRLYSAADAVGSDFRLVRDANNDVVEFVITTDGGYISTSRDVLLIENADKSARVAIVPGALPDSADERGGINWTVAGLADHVFRRGFGSLLEIAGRKLAGRAPDNRLVDAYASDIAYRHPADASEHAGDGLFFASRGVAQYHRFTVATAIQKIGTALLNDVGETFRGRIQVRRLTGLGAVNPAAGTLVQEFAYAAGSYLADIELTLDEPAFFRAGEYLFVYAIADEGFSINARNWTAPLAGQANPNGRQALAYSNEGETGWSLAGVTSDYAYYQVPLRLWTNIVSRSELTALMAKAGLSTPRLVLPSRMQAMVGRPFALPYDAFALLPEVGSAPPSMTFDVFCPVGQPGPRFFAYVPANGDVGNYPFIVTAYDVAGNVVQQVTSTLAVVAAANAATAKNVLIVGDSTKADTGALVRRLQEVLASLPGTTPTFVGTHGAAPYAFEARSGMDYAFFARGAYRLRFTVTGFPAGVSLWSSGVVRGLGSGADGHLAFNEERSLANGAGTIVGALISNPAGQDIKPGWTGQLRVEANGSSYTFTVTNVEAIPAYSPFKDAGGGGELNFAESFARRGVTLPDLAVFDLGINGSRGAPKSEVEQLVRIADSKALIGAYLAAKPGGKAAICLPKSCSSLRGENALHDAYRANLHRFRELIVEHFDNAAYDPRVRVIGTGLMIDRFYGYSRTTIDISPACPGETMQVCTDMMHPPEAGYRQEAEGFVAAITAALT